jgi:rhodanese-related sulfurtransferase
VKNKIEDKDIAYNFAFGHPLPPIHCEPAETGEFRSSSAPPPPPTLTKMRHIVVVLARTGKSMKEVKILTDQAYGNISLKKKQMCKIFKEVKSGKNTGDESVSNP